MAAPQFIGPSSAEISSSSLQSMLEGMNLMRDMGQFYRKQQLEKHQDLVKQAETQKKSLMETMGLQTESDVALHAPEFYNGYLKTTLGVSDKDAEKLRQRVINAPPTLGQTLTQQQIVRATTAGYDEEPAPEGTESTTPPAKDVNYEVPKEEGTPPAGTTPKPEKPNDFRVHGQTTTDSGQPLNLALFDLGRNQQNLGQNYATYDELQKKYAKIPYTENEGTEAHPRPAKFTAGIGAQLLKDADKQLKSIDDQLAAIKRQEESTPSYARAYMQEQWITQRQQLEAQKLAIANQKLDIGADIKKYNEAMNGIDSWRVSEMDSLAERGFTGSLGEDYAGMQSIARQIAATNPNMFQSTPVTAPSSMQTEQYDPRVTGSYSGRIPEFAGPYDTRNIEESAPAPAASAPATAAAAPAPQVPPARNASLGVAGAPQAGAMTPSSAGEAVAGAAAGVAEKTALPESPTKKDVIVQNKNFKDIYYNSFKDLAAATQDPAERKRILGHLRMKVTESDYWDTVVAASGDPTLAAQLAQRGDLKRVMELEELKVKAALAQADASIAQSKAAITSAEIGERRDQLQLEMTQLEKSMAAERAVLEKQLAASTIESERLQLQQQGVALRIAEAQLAAQIAAQKDEASSTAYKNAQMMYDNAGDNMFRVLDKFVINKNGEKSLNWDAIEKDKNAIDLVNGVYGQMNQALKLMEAASGTKFPDSMYMPQYKPEQYRGAWATFWNLQKFKTKYVPQAYTSGGTGAGGAPQPAPKPGTGKPSSDASAILDEAGIPHD